jgi:hypothetical protein
MNPDTPIRFPGLAIKTVITHTITYFVMGILAFNFLHYAEAFRQPELASWMRQTTDPLVMAGPLFQPIRGVVFALVFYPLRWILFWRKRGWLLIWWILVALGILSTFGPAPGSLEGMVYTTIPLQSQILGWLEVIPQAFLLSGILFYWVNHPGAKWLNWTLGSLFVLAMLLSVLGLLLPHA